jgi:intracellular sulfur oxidation DsrE/DsrF family protein
MAVTICSIIFFRSFSDFFINTKTCFMNTNETKEGTDRRSFLGTLATGAAAVGLSTIAPSINAFGGVANFDHKVYGDPEEIFKKITGKHRVVYDSTEPNGLFPFAWPRIFLVTNEMTGTANKDCSVMVVLRHDSIGYALSDAIWSKYKLGELFKAPDPKTNEPATRNPFWKPKAGEYSVPGIGEVQIGINQLQDSGVLFVACNMALTVYSAVAAQKMNMKPEDAKKEWMDNVLPGIQVVPSGVWALGRAQEKQCAYIFAG